MQLAPLARLHLASKTRAFPTSGPRNAKSAARRLVTRAALPVAADAPGGGLPALRKFMMKNLGWEEGWVDSIAGEFKKRGLKADAARLEAVVKYLKMLGIPNLSVCNMAAICKDFLLSDVSSLQEVISYIKQRGVTGKALVSLLETHPGLLTYKVSRDGKTLEKGKARASVDVVDGPNGRVAGVSYWREGAAFGTAPVAPLKPGSM